ncbi:MAG TPA: HepT-like ribonuclease domain-containing protein [Actinomycetota bacterium]|nr:HepT-like ribonuclease domain-containing protein [Actinomycetota bacterium]
MSDRDRTYLVHIVECIDRIQRYLASDKAEFVADMKGQDAIIRNLQVLAESSKRVSRGVKSLHPEIEWAAIAGFRNVLVHDYLEVDVDEVWEVVTRDLQPLRSSVERILAAKGWTEEQDVPRA